MSSFNWAVGGSGKTAMRGDTLKAFVGPFTKKAVIRVTPHPFLQTMDGLCSPHNASRSDPVSSHLQITIVMPPGINCTVKELQNMGEYIVVERTISKENGQAPFKVFDRRGQVRTTKKDHVMRLMDCLDFQVDNPVQVMQQGMAKEFLHKADPKK